MRKKPYTASSRPKTAGSVQICISMSGTRQDSGLMLLNPLERFGESKSKTANNGKIFKTHIKLERSKQWDHVQAAEREAYSK